MALHDSKSFSKIIAFHPSYNEEKKDELKGIKTPTLILWNKLDQMHPYKKWLPLAQKIPNSTIVSWDNPKATHKEENPAYHEKIVSPIVKFLTGVDPLASQVQVHEAKTEQIASTGGKAVTSINNIMLAEDLSAEEIQKLATAPDLQREAIALFIKYVNDPQKGFKDIVESRINNTHPRREFYKNVLNKMPQLDFQNLSSPDFLVEYGIWDKEPQDWQQMMETPRYFAGRRQVLVNLNVASNLPSNEGYMVPTKESSSEKFVTHKVSIEKVEKDFFTVQNETG